MLSTANTLLGVIVCLSEHGVYAGFADLDQSGKSCRDLGDCRNTWDIIWSCLATIFSCTWVALHLNVPKQGKGELWKFGRHAFYFMVALIAPELMIALAHKQRSMAKKIAAEHKDYGWTLAHGFFANMGGIMVHDTNDGKDYLIHPDNICAYLRDGQIIITEKEIRDKSKGDALTKGFVVVQTTWFILQLIARTLQHLPITELEFATLAFAILNGATYSMWWEKPLGVHHPIVLTMPIRVVDEDVENQEKCQQEYNHHQLSSLGFAHPGVRNEEYRATYHILAAVGVLFGSIHCIAWISYFPTPSEKLLWQIASVTTVVLPLTIAVAELLSEQGRLSNNGRAISIALLGTIYPIARLFLLVLAFTTLRSLPPDSYTTVRWTAFIPHI
ncbi:hypothetical protein BDZ94DRAFT_1250264 [Collybia nuda]|uniref:Uncharacterized protein n=1 Tax=Collybia nuda TaxID=64659 RepID=A0A9P5YDR3_9AGAR|nr:hypothetical protein BDZ94DRAFT_1250264 [Collybia nuda]